jgi:UDP-glucose 4-epimerase
MDLVISSDIAVGNSYNIGDPRSVLTTLGLAQTICRVLNSSSKIEHVPELSADVELRVPNIDRAKRDLDFHASVGLEDGILETAQYYQSLGASLPTLSGIFGD